jgi:HD superfamily phosphohydrolase YqeK
MFTVHGCGMRQVTKNQTTVKVCPYVPRRVRDTAERLAKRAMSKTKKPVFSTPYIANWATAAHDIFAAQTDDEALAIFNELRGKPLTLPVVTP